MHAQVETVTERVLFLLASMLPPRLYPALLRVPAVLENQEAVGEMRRSVKALFPKLPLQQVVALLAAFPEVQAKSVLNDDILQSPTRCRVLQVLHLPSGPSCASKFCLRSALLQCLGAKPTNCIVLLLQALLIHSMMLSQLYFMQQCVCRRLGLLPACGYSSAHWQVRIVEASWRHNSRA